MVNRITPPKLWHIQFYTTGPIQSGGLMGGSGCDTYPNLFAYVRQLNEELPKGMELHITIRPLEEVVSLQ